MGRRHTEEIVKILRETEESDNVGEVLRRRHVSEQNFYRWRRKCGG